MRVLVTGAAGFIGSHLLPKLLEAGYGVIALDRILSYSSEIQGKIKRAQVDIMDITGAASESFDSLIHLAAIAAPRYAEKNPDEAFKTNVLGTYNVLKMAKDANAKKVIFASTAHVYGISPRYMPTDENHPLALGDTYTTSKILGEQLCQLFYENHDIPYTILRLFNGYGPRQSLDYFIPSMIAQALGKRGLMHPDNRKIVLRGGRAITKDFIYVEDIADAMMRALESDFVGALNIGTGKQTTLEEVALFIARAFGVPLAFEEFSDGGPTHMQCDPSRAKRILGWRAKVDIEEGLRRTCEEVMKS